MIVGERMVRTCRSTKDSHEQRAIPMQGTHCCQARVREAAVGETLAITPPRISSMWHLVIWSVIESLTRQPDDQMAKFTLALCVRCRENGGFVLREPLIERQQGRRELLCDVLAARPEHFLLEVAIDLEHVAH